MPGLTRCRGGAGSLTLAAAQRGATLLHLPGLGRLALLGHTSNDSHQPMETASSGAATNECGELNNKLCLLFGLK